MKDGLDCMNTLNDVGCEEQLDSGYHDEKFRGNLDNGQLTEFLSCQQPAWLAVVVRTPLADDLEVR